ncbi:hypothetical protein [Pseudomonas putida]|uniref:Uncharacterized protein n=1 Tax=Pseudomonas putida TaxID=303 RepID=A0A2S3WD44_PSEPU|nr:hypothetical protein [Pseudomonas putida]POF88821.1 hypothetical protein BGP80_12930 [Pseudomonas putida]
MVEIVQLPDPRVSELVDIQALYTNANGFVALRRDGRVAVRNRLDTFVTYHATSSSRGRALMAQQRQSVIAAR